MYSGNLNLNSYNPQKSRMAFGKRQNMTKAEKDLMRTIRDAAEEYRLPDFYTGRIFGKKYHASIEHLVEFCRGKKGTIGNLPKINAMENLAPVGILINNQRNNIPLTEWYKMHPEYLINGQKALEEYEKVQKVGLNGKLWVQGLKRTLNNELGFIAFTGNINKLQKSSKLSCTA